MIHSGYQTFGQRSLNIEETVKTLTMGMVRGDFKSVNNVSTPVYALIESDYPVPFFNLPHTVSVKNTDHVIIDARHYRREYAILENKSINIIKGTPTYALAVMASLEYLWNNQSAAKLLTFKLPMKSYATYISENITRKLGLDINAQLLLLVAFAYFYLTRSHTTTEMTEKEADEMGMVIRRVCGIQPEIIQQYKLTQGSNKIFRDIGEMCEFLRTTNWSNRLVRISPVFITSVLINLRLGFTNNASMITTALEYPPIWIGLCHMHVSAQHLKKNLLGEVIWRINRGEGSPQQFLQEISYFAQLA